MSYVMTVSGNGQVSIPAETRARWRATHVVVVDLGDHLCLRPQAEHPTVALRGKHRDRGPSTAEARRVERAADVARDRRRR